MGLGGNPYGPAGTGKTESVKALGGLFGRQVLVFNCDEVSTNFYPKCIILYVYICMHVHTCMHIICMYECGGADPGFHKGGCLIHDCVTAWFMLV